MNIVSLLPSATEIICALGLDDSLVGVSHECDYPVNIIDLPRVTSSVIDKNLSSIEIDQQVREHLQSSDALYMLDLLLLESLQPELIVTQALCDVCAVSAVDVEDAVCRLPSSPTVINLEPGCLADVYATIEQVGAITNRKSVAWDLLDRMQARIERVQAVTLNSAHRPKVACLEWLDPPFNAGHWTPEIVTLAGGISVTGLANKPSHTISWQTLVDAEPDVVFVACCGYSLDRTLTDLPLLLEGPKRYNPSFWKDKQLFVTDGNHYFNRPGPRLIDSLEILADALHPGQNLLGSELPAAIAIPAGD